jgi:apolipoprotein N-acyltransferase
MQNVRYAPLGFQQISAATLASATSLTVPAGATVAVVAPDTAAVRWRDDGTAPTTSVGMSLAAATVFEYWGNLSAIQFIAQTGSPVLNISYYKIDG